MASHYVGEGYSERHPVPTVQEFREIEAQREAAAAANAKSASASQAQPPISDLEGLRQRKGGNVGTSDAPTPPPKDGQASASSTGVEGGDKEKDPPREGEVDSGKGGGQAEKERIKKAAGPQGKPNQFTAKGERVVTDPVTGGDVVITDSSDKTKIDPDKLDSRYPGGFSTEPINSDKGQDQKYPAPHPAQPSSILLQQFPPPINTDALKKLNSHFDQLAIALAASMALVWFFTAFGAGWFRFLLRTTIVGTVAFCGWCALHLSKTRIEHDFEAVRMHQHTQRGEKHSPPMPESTEWLNAAIACIWKQINPDMFIPMADQVEDIMQASLPGFIDGVKISGISQGESPFRLIAMRGLADVMGDKDYPREEWIATPEERAKIAKEKAEADAKAGKQTNDPAENDADGDGINDDDESGDFLNYEVSFSYSARPGDSEKDRSKNIHLLVEFFLGGWDLFRIPLPIWIQINHISGTVRLRAQMVQQPPYIRNLTVTLMGVPNIQISAIPMTRALPNVLDLPLISGFVQSSIAAATNAYVAPQSLTLNMAQMLSGDGVKKDTEALGVLCVQIKRGINLSVQDAGGSSDPYVVLSFAKFGRPLYSSRIIFEDLNPVWEETAFLLVNKDDVRGDESLSVQLWDSDKRTADDIVGRVQQKLSVLMAEPNKMTERTDDLMGFEDADEMQGQLNWSVGYFEKTKLNRALMDTRKKEEKSNAEQATDREAAPIDSKEEADALHCPPDPRWKSGILSFHIHNITGLETREVEKGVKGEEREGKYGQDVEATNQGSSLPNGYCELIVNDDIVYKTRAKYQTNMPFFEAGTEVFIRDWTRAQARIVVRDARTREHDPILGLNSIDLSELFSSSSQVTRAFPLQDGVGYGRVHASFVFKAVKLDLPKELIGWDTATVEVLSNVSIEGHSSDVTQKLNSKKLTISTGDVTRKLKKGEEQPEDAQGGPQLDALLRLPVYDRYSSNVVFRIGGGGFGPFGGKPDAIAVLPLASIADDEATDVELQVLAGDNLGTLERNFINEKTKETHDYEVIGTLKVKLRLDSGLDEDHEALAVGQTDRHEFEVYNRLEGMPKQAEKNAHADDDGIVDRKEQKAINKAKSDALHARHRGVMGYKSARTGKWAKDGLKDRVRTISNKITGNKGRDQTVASEA